MPPRLSLTKSQIGTVIGAELLQLLETVTEDGRLDVKEAEGLADWLLKNQGTEFPAVGHLIRVLHQVLADGRIDPDELLFLQRELEAVMPPEWRRSAVQRRRQADKADLERQLAEADEARREFARMRPDGVFDFCVAGVAYDGRGEFIGRVLNQLEGAEVNLGRMPSNPFDENAVLVSALGGELGYMPRDDAACFAPMLDEGRRYTATVKKVLTGGRRPVPVIKGEIHARGEAAGSLAAVVSYESRPAGRPASHGRAEPTVSWGAWILFGVFVIIVLLLMSG